MANVSPLPLRLTLLAALKDTFGDIKGFARAVALIWVAMLIFVDAPSLYLAESINRGIVEELKKKGEIPEEAPSTAGLEEKKKALDPALVQKLSREDIRNAIKMEYLALNMLLSLAQALLVFSFVVAWYKGLLLGQGQGKMIIPLLGRMEWDYGWTSMKVGLVSAPIIIVMMGFALAGSPEFAAETGGEDIRKHIPLFVIGTVALVYLQSRLAMAYPLTIVGKKNEVLKQAWKMTEGNGLQIMMGNILLMVPLMLVMIGVIMGVAWLLQTLGFEPAPRLSLDPTPFTTHVAAMMLRGLGGIFTLAMLAALSAFHARLYAYFVRVQQPA